MKAKLEMHTIGNEKSMSYSVTKLKILIQHCIYINVWHCSVENLD